MTKTNRQVVAVGILVCLTLCGIGLVRTGVYGWTLFVVFPVILGGLSTWVFQPATATRALGLSAMTLGIASCSFLVMGLEGSVCIVMSLPLIVPLGMFGGWLTYRLMHRRRAGGELALMLLLTPGAFLWDIKAPPPVYEVRTAITVAASPEQVWKHVISFSELPDPPEWYFRDGIAYPIRARIEGSGPGAVRYCEFSTGPFIEPIQVWDEPHLLAFSVTTNPAPMNEWSPYGKIVTKHLHGYLISKHGQFRLTALPNGQTRLEGSTWYQHGLWPAPYWKLWSDAIIHRIHLRVLNHVRALAEQDARLTASDTR